METGSELQAIERLAQLIVSQRGESRRKRTLTMYVTQLRGRMHEIQRLQVYEITGEDLFRTIPRLEAASWEEVPQEEKELYIAVVRDFNQEKKMENGVLERKGSSAQ